jgi:integrase
VVVKVIEQARASGQNAIALYVWLVAITGVRRGELCAVQVRDLDLANGVLHVAYNYVVKGGKKVRKDTKTHQDRYLAIDPLTCTLIQDHLAAAEAALVGTDTLIFPGYTMRPLGDSRAWSGTRFPLRGSVTSG